MTAHTPGPWVVTPHPAPDVEVFGVGEPMNDREMQFALSHTVCYQNAEANARLIAAAPTMHEEMQRFLEVIERAEADSEVWTRLTAGTGIATANAYRAAIAKAKGESDGR